jgi:hypothetical protein
VRKATARNVKVMHPECSNHTWAHYFLLLSFAFSKYGLFGWNLEAESILPLFSGMSHSVDNICLEEALVMTFEIFTMLDFILINTYCYLICYLHGQDT